MQNPNGSAYGAGSRSDFVRTGCFGRAKQPYPALGHYRIRLISRLIPNRAIGTVKDSDLKVMRRNRGAEPAIPHLHRAGFNAAIAQSIEEEVFDGHKAYRPGSEGRF
jgi:hypothetical protein